MAQGKNKKLSKGKKGLKVRTGDPFYKKKWMQLKAPQPFSPGSFGWTCVSRSTGLSILIFIRKSLRCHQR